jgi:hypothetical protein
MDTPGKNIMWQHFCPPLSVISLRKWDEMEVIVDVDKKEEGLNFLRCIGILSHCDLSLSFLPNPFLLCKNTFMRVKS